MTDLTVVVGIDQVTARQLLISWETWRKHRPDMWKMPWVVFYDWEPPKGLYESDVVTLCRDVMKLPDVRLVKWPEALSGGHRPSYENQRERMLTGFCHVPAFAVETEWWMKIDTDSVALRESHWLDPEWFKPKRCVTCGRTDPTALQSEIDCGDCRDDWHIGHRNAWIASSWGYTKPADQMARLDDWADRVPGLSEYPRLDLPYEPGSKRCCHPRMASWLSFYRTEWTRMCYEFCRDTLPPQRIPVPSQDGFHFYCSQRRGDRYHKTKMKRRGWTNCPRREKLIETAREALK